MYRVYCKYHNYQGEVTGNIYILKNQINKKKTNTESTLFLSDRF